MVCFPGCSRLVPKTPRLLICCYASVVASANWYTWPDQLLPPCMVAEALSLFDSDIRRCFTECTSVDVSDVAWHQAQLSPSRRGLGLRSLYHHSSACFIASISQSGIALRANNHLEQSIDDLNHIIGDSDAVSVQDILDAPPRQRIFSCHPRLRTSS